MDLTQVLNAISTVGFPIAIAIWFMVVDHKDSQSSISAINSMANAVENNTKILEKLESKIG